MLEIKESTPPINLIGARRWRVVRKEYINATDYDLMCEDECYGTFRSLEELRRFAEMLRGDLEKGRAMATKTRESFREIVAVVAEIA